MADAPQLRVLFRFLRRRNNGDVLLPMFLFRGRHGVGHSDRLGPKTCARLIGVLLLVLALVTAKDTVRLKAEDDAKAQRLRAMALQRAATQQAATSPAATEP
jgi:hypothetical protein